MAISYGLNMGNITTPLGGIAMIDKVEKEYNLISELFYGIGESKDFIGRVKVLLNNRLTYSTSVLQIPNILDPEVLPLFGLEKITDRSLNRAVQKVGMAIQIIQERYQNFLEKNRFVDGVQNLDWTSAHLEGNVSELAAYGHPKDGRTNTKQISIGLSVGSTNIPTAITIQKGNMNDKKHFGQTYRILKRVLAKGSFLVFDCGANTKTNKATIKGDGYEYLTLKQKHVSTYKRYINIFNNSTAVVVKIKPKDQGNAGEGQKEEIQDDAEEVGAALESDKTYLCVKVKADGEDYKYIYFSEVLFNTQIAGKGRLFRKQMENGNELVKKAKKHKETATIPSDAGWVKLYPAVQATLQHIENPYITGLEGFFILESSADLDPEQALLIYKNRNVAEKFIRDLKEGMEMGPIRHWTTDAIIGILFLSFLAKAIESLTLHLAKIPIDKNVKLLKKFLINLTWTAVKPDNAFKFTVVSNISDEIRAIFGDFLDRYGTKDLNLRW